MMTDPIADMLTRIRNAGNAGHRWVDMPVSKLKVEIAKSAVSARITPKDKAKTESKVEHTISIRAFRIGF